MHLCPECEFETDVELELQEHVAETHGLITREGLMRLANEAANLVVREMGWDGGTREQDAINLLVNAITVVMDDPDTTVDEVMDASYDGGAEEVRSWWPGWQRLA